MLSDESEKLRWKAQMLLEEEACEEMLDHFTMMKRIEPSSGMHIRQGLLMKRMNGNKWIDADTVQGPIEGVMREMILEALILVKTEKVTDLIKLC